MTPTIEIAAGARDEVLVFALDGPAPADDAGIAAALGTEVDVAGAAEVIEVADLTGVGLAGYLSEGMGLEDAQVAADREVLDGLTGAVIVLRARAFGGLPATLSPREGVRLIGRYGPPAPTPVAPLESASAGGAIAAGGKGKSDARIGGMVATAALVVLALLAILMVLIA
ncbi:MAG: hypothetical protein ACU0BF_03920 [Paracoccaceae bacterium]